MFLKKMIIKLFQSHRNTAISFARKITVFVGESQSGKTAIKRAAELAAFNKYGSASKNKGHNYFSDFAGDEGQTKIIVDTNRGRISLGKTIQIKDGQKKAKPNGTVYSAGGAFFRGARRVPDVVKRILNFGSINFQGTLDSPFLVTAGAAEISKQINKILNIDIADEWRLEANRAVSETTARVDKLTIEQKEIKDRLSALSLPPEIPDNELKLDNVCKTLYKIEEKLNIIGDIENAVEDIEQNEISVDAVNEIIEKIAAVEKVIRKIVLIENTINRISKYEKTKTKIKMLDRQKNATIEKIKRFLEREGICPFCEEELNQSKIDVVLSRL